MELHWHSRAFEDLELLDWSLREQIISKTIVALLGDDGEFIAEGPNCSFYRVKPISGYWVLYSLYPDRKEITAVTECMRELTKGSMHATVRIAQIRNETKLEFNRLKYLVEGLR